MFIYSVMVLLIISNIFFFPGFYDRELFKRKYFLLTNFWSTSVWVALSEGLQAGTTICIPKFMWEKMTHGWQVHFGYLRAQTLSAEIEDVS